MSVEVKRKARPDVSLPIKEIVATSSTGRVLKAFDEGPSGYISVTFTHPAGQGDRYMMASFRPQEIIDLGDALVELGQQVRDR